jgi:hypothetical protein
MTDIPGLRTISAEDWLAMDPLSRASLVAALVVTRDPKFAAHVERALSQIEIAFDDLDDA